MKEPKHDRGMRGPAMLAMVMWPWSAIPLSQGCAEECVAIDYFHYFLVALIVVQSIAIATLLIRNRRHRQARITVEKHYAELTHAARLLLAGEITASIAHEVAQPLSAILTNAETAELLLTDAHPDLTVVREILADIRRDDLRANDIVHHLRGLLRRKELQRESTDINALAASVLRLIRSDALRRNIEIRTALAPQLPPVAVDPVHLQQVLLNLMINAMDAMQEMPATRRSLDVSTSLHNDDSIEVAIADTGHGMTPEQMAQVFESFFTTKQEGMGLGLSIARSIVQAHGGTIWAETRQSGGTAFRFTIPLHS